MRGNDDGDLGQRDLRVALERVLAGVEEDVGETYDETAFGFLGGKDRVQLVTHLLTQLHDRVTCCISTGVGVRCCCFGLGALRISLSFCSGSAFGFQLRLLGCQGGLLCLSFCCLTGIYFGLTLFRDTLANAGEAGVFSTLYSFTCEGDLHLFIALLGTIHVVGVLQTCADLSHDARFVVIGTGKASDVVGVVCLVELKRRVLVPCDRVENRLRTGGLCAIKSLGEKGVFCVYLLQNARGLVLKDNVLQNDHVRRNLHCEVRLCGDDQTKGLKIGRHFDVVLRTCGKDFTEVGRCTVWRNGPQNIGQVLRAEAAGGREALKLGIDVDGAALTFNLRFTLGSGQKNCALEADARGAGAVQVVHSIEVALHNIHTIQWNTVDLADRTATVLDAVRLCGACVVRGVWFLCRGREGNTCCKQSKECVPSNFHGSCFSFVDADWLRIPFVGCEEDGVGRISLFLAFRASLPGKWASCRVALSLVRDHEFVAYGEECKFKTRGDAGLVKDIREMALDRFFRDVE